MKAAAVFFIVRMLFLLPVLTLAGGGLRAQYVYTINADSVKITNHCDTAELIIENHTQNVPGFLFNKGRGRTEFKKVLQKINDSLYLLGGDTLKTQPYAWLQGGNAFGVTGKFGTLDNNHLDFYTNNTQQGRWTSTGNLLLGTTADNGSRLQVNGSSWFNGGPVINLNGNTIDFITPSPTNTPFIRFTNGQNNHQFLLGSGNSTYADVLGIGYSDGNPATNAFTTFGMYKSTFGANYGSHSVFINGPYFTSYNLSGYGGLVVGGDLNTSGFGPKLDFAVGDQFLANPVIGGGIFMRKTNLGGSNGSNLNTEMSFHLRQDSASVAEIMRLKSNGNVLVGTTDDYNYKLQVAGRGSIYVNPNLSRSGDRIRIGGYINTEDGQNVLFSTSNDGGASYKNVLVERDGYIGLGHSPYGWWVGSPPLRILDNGIVSIFSPSLYFGNTGGPYNASALVTSVSNVSEWQENLGNYPSRQNYYYFGTVLQTPEGTNVRAPLKISGRELHWLTGTIDAEAGMITESGNTIIGAATDNGNKFQVNGTSYFSDKTGIGTASPTAQLHTTGSVRFAGLIEDSTIRRVLVSDANGNVSYRTLSSWASNGVFNSDLAVNGVFSAQKMKVSSHAWADYVFDKSYRLPSLPEVEDFIKQNKHLPGIPAAAEVQRNGIDLGESQAALLKKIEELTLYMIEQEKKLKEQTEEINTLKEQNKRLSSLEQRMDEIMKHISK